MDMPDEAENLLIGRMYFQKSLESTRLSDMHVPRVLLFPLDW